MGCAGGRGLARSSFDKLRAGADLDVMSFPREVAGSDLAMLIGLDERSVRKLVAKQILHRNARGLFDVPDAILSYFAFRESALAAKYGQGVLGRARAEVYVERAKLMRLRREELENKLVPVAEVIAMGTSIATLVKTRLLGIGARLAPRLVNLKTPAAAQKLVYDETWEALDELSKLTAVPRSRRS